MRSGSRAHFYEPVRRFQDLHVVVYEDDGVSMCSQIAQHPQKAVDVSRMKTDRRLVQHVQHACRTVPNSPGQLDALTLAGRQRRASPVDRQVSQT